METNNKPYYQVTFTPNVTRILKDPTQINNEWFQEQIYPDLDMVYNKSKPYTIAELAKKFNCSMDNMLYESIHKDNLDMWLNITLFGGDFGFYIYRDSIDIFTNLEPEFIQNTINDYFNNEDEYNGGDMFDMDYEYFTIGHEVLECTEEFKYPGWGYGFIRQCNLSII